MSNITPFYQYLNFLRVLFAIDVFVFHLTFPRFGIFPENYWKSPVGYAYAIAGFLFVSGFFVTHLLKKPQMGVKNFAVNRFLRIYSVFIPCLIITWILDSIGSSLQSSLYDSKAYNPENAPFQFISTSLFLNQIWFHKLRFGTNGSLWTLNYEIWYYFVAVALLSLKKFKYLLLLLVLVFMGPKIMALLPCFLLGSLFYLYKDKLPRLPSLTLPAILGAMVFLWVYLETLIRKYLYIYPAFSKENLNYSWNFLPNIVFTAMLFILSLYIYQRPHLVEKVDFRIRNLIDNLAKKAYSFYAFHNPLIMFFAALYMYLGIYTPSVIGFLMVAVSTLITCYTLSIFELHNLRKKLT